MFAGNNPTFTGRGGGAEFQQRYTNGNNVYIACEIGFLPGYSCVLKSASMCWHRSNVDVSGSGSFNELAAEPYGS